MVILSILSILFKGLNYGVDFKGGTLIELRINDNQTNISSLRSAFNNMNLGDVAIKNFGNDNDFLIKFVKKEKDKNLIQNIKKDLTKTIGPVFEFRRVESVGPKVSAELLNKGLIAIAASLGAMLFYIWIRFEWQFSLGAIMALFHDVIVTLGIFSLLSFEINLSIIAAVLIRLIAKSLFMRSQFLYQRVSFLKGILRTTCIKNKEPKKKLWDDIEVK